MKIRQSLKCFLVGILICLFVLSPITALAQFGLGIVFDPKALAEAIKAHLEEARRWVDTVQHYQEMYTKAVEQLTTLRGVLTTVDKQLFKNQQAALLANDIAKIISDAEQLKRQLEHIMRYQITFLKSIDDRLEQGIFDPDADMRDLQNWLLYSMGRDAKQTVDQLMSYVNADTELAVWRAEREKQCVELVKISQQLTNDKALRDSMPATPDDQYNIDQLNAKIFQEDVQATKLKGQIDDLTKKIQERLKKWGLRMQDMQNFAQKVDANEEMWKEWQQNVNDMQNTMNNIIINAPQPSQ